MGVHIQDFLLIIYLLHGGIRVEHAESAFESSGFNNNCCEIFLETRYTPVN